MNKTTAHVLWFNEIRKTDIPVVGGKGANLGEMTFAGIPVPNGYVVTATAYFDFLKATSLKTKILTELAGLDVNNSKSLMRASKNIKTAILTAAMPEDLKKKIRDYYQGLCGEYDRLVAVRSSATAEDLPDASFAGQQETYLNVKGYQDVVKNVQKCWASLFESRAIFYRATQGFDHFKVGIAVPVQLMVQSEIAGIMFTVNPLTTNSSEISIEAAFGLGQPIVSGEVTPDQYLVDKKSGKITYKYISKQTWQMILGEEKAPISKKYQEEQKLTDKYVLELAHIGQKIEEYYGKPQDIEWGLENKKLYIVQSRPVTTLKVTGKAIEYKEERKVDPTKSAKFILEGLAASPGVASGPVKIINNAKEIGNIKQGDVLVADMTNPDYVPAMKRACAVLTNSGGRTSHAAIVSRELGVPAVVGSKNATTMLKNGEIITVDGFSGRVYEGNIIVTEQKVQDAPKISGDKLKTATKVYVNLAEPEAAEKIAKRNVDGIGLLRAEFMIAQIGIHPRVFIKEKREQEFVTKLAEGLEEFAKAFGPRPVVYRFTDFRSNEYAGLQGGKEFEKDEPNPMIGYRGTGRYLDDSAVFKLEVEALKIVRNKKGYKNLHVMFPFVRTVGQLRAIKKIMGEFGLKRSGNFKVWMMVEIPSNVILLDDFLKEGLDGVSVGSNDLTMLTLGVDRDNEKVAPTYSEMDPALLYSFEKIVTTCKKHGVTCSMCGQAPSVYPELVEKLVQWGITSVSVSPDVLEKTREIVYEAEKKVLGKKVSHAKN